MQLPRSRPPGPSPLSLRPLSPFPSTSELQHAHGHGATSAGNLSASTVALSRRATSTHIPNFHRPTPVPLKRATTSYHTFSRRSSALSTRDSSMSRASSLAPSPLDDIPEALWDRTLLRTTSAIETRHVDFSIEEITDTRMSLDDQAMLGLLQRSNNRARHHGQASAMQRAFCGIWGGTSDRLRSMKKKVRSFPRGIFARAQSAPAALPLERDSYTTCSEDGQDYLPPATDAQAHRAAPSSKAARALEELGRDTPATTKNACSPVLIRRGHPRSGLPADPKYIPCGQKLTQRSGNKTLHAVVSGPSRCPTVS